ILDRHILALDIAGFFQALMESGYAARERPRRRAVEEPDHRHRRLLGARHQRPGGHAAEKRDELAPPHSITSSARSRIDVGMSMPMARAVLRLTIVVNFVARSTGRSAGFAPLRILSTKTAARQSISGKFIP